MKKNILLAVFSLFGIGMAKSSEVITIKSKIEYSKFIEKHVAFKVTSSNGCVFSVDGTVTLSWGSFESFTGTITITGPNPPCPIGKHIFTFTAQEDRGHLEYVSGDTDIFNDIMADQENLAIPIWDNIQL